MSDETGPTRWTITPNPGVPPDEIHFVVDGKVVGVMTNIAPPTVTVTHEPEQPMSDETIAPALTAEEWAMRGAARDTLNAWATPEGVCIGDLDTRDAKGTPYTGTTYCDEERHALAALALHGQPFGFTHADVDTLRGVAGDYETPRGFLPAGVALRTLAARIAALLPPEGTHGE